MSSRGPLAEVDHKVLAEFANFLSMYKEIHDKKNHRQLQNDHLWALKGNTDWNLTSCLV
jgi:hypothetical protein